MPAKSPHGTRRSRTNAAALSHRRTPFWRANGPIERYRQQKVEAATEHLLALPPADLALVRRVLRDQLVSDPELRRLVQQAMGSSSPRRGGVT